MTAYDQPWSRRTKWRVAFYIPLAIMFVLAVIAYQSTNIFWVLGSLVAGLAACVVAILSPRNTVFREEEFPPE